MTTSKVMSDEEETDDFGGSEVSEYDGDGNSTGACPHCGVSPVLADDMGGGTCGHYLALYDGWGGQDDFSELPALPCLGTEWKAACAALFAVVEGEGFFAPHPLLTASFGGDLAMLNAWATEGLCGVPTWDEITRDLLLVETNGVEAVVYATGTVFYAADGGAQLKRTVARLKTGFAALAEVLNRSKTAL